MDEKKIYTVNTYREGNWVMVEVPEIDGLTQARTEDEAPHMARDLIALTLDRPMESFDVAVNARN